MAWSKLTELELRALLRALKQPADGGKAVLVQRVTAFFVSDGEATGDDGDVGEAAALPGESKVDDGAHRMACAGLKLARSQAAVVAAQAAFYATRVQYNEGSCALLQLVGHDDLRPTFLRAEVWGVVGLWRLRGVCRAFREWAQAALSSLPRVVAVAGLVKEGNYREIATSSVESLDLSTMRWSAAGCMPSLPDPRAYHSVSCSPDGRVVVCCGYNMGGADPMDHLMGTALQWLPGTGTWSALPDLPARRLGAASVRLPDGRTMLIGGSDSRDDGNDPALASVVVLAADGSGWSDLPPLMGARDGAAAALLPDGKVLVAGGQSGPESNTALKTAELWDPATQKWTALPPMAHKRTDPAACVLPSGRVAVVGGMDANGYDHEDGEVFDPVKREWEPLGAEMANDRDNISVVAVAGGLIVARQAAEDEELHSSEELYDEESGRWFELPQHPMAEPRTSTALVSVPVAALAVAG